MNITSPEQTARYDFEHGGMVFGRFENEPDLAKRYKTAFWNIEMGRIEQVSLQLAEA